jgi:hypothetical protein
MPKTNQNAVTQADLPEMFARIDEDQALLRQQNLRLANTWPYLHFFIGAGVFAGTFLLAKFIL